MRGNYKNPRPSSKRLRAGCGTLFPMPRSRPLAVLSAAAGAGAAEPARLEFNRDIRPILSENCFQCHGQDPAKREGKLRLDERAGATLARDGIAAIVPGQPDESELLRRVTSKDTSEQMPPPSRTRRSRPPKPPCSAAGSPRAPRMRSTGRSSRP